MKFPLIWEKPASDLPAKSAGISIRLADSASGLRWTEGKKHREDDHKTTAHTRARRTSMFRLDIVQATIDSASLTPNTRYMCRQYQQTICNDRVTTRQAGALYHLFLDCTHNAMPLNTKIIPIQVSATGTRDTLAMPETRQYATRRHKDMG
jgi:hypothetical protein